MKPSSASKVVATAGTSQITLSAEQTRALIRGLGGLAATDASMALVDMLAEKLSAPPPDNARLVNEAKRKVELAHGKCKAFVGPVFYEALVCREALALISSNESRWTSFADAILQDPTISADPVTP